MKTDKFYLEKVFPEPEKVFSYTYKTFSERKAYISIYFLCILYKMLFCSEYHAG